MARPSKSKSQSHPFTIHEDTGIPTPDPGYQPSLDDTLKERNRCNENEEIAQGENGNEQPHLPGGYEDPEATVTAEIDDHPQNGDDSQRRTSAFTNRTSISSLPESNYQTEDTDRKPSYTPPIIRPSFMRPESVRRIQMSSPPPFGSRSPRQSVLRHSRSRTGTPHSVRSSVNARGSPRPRSQRHISEETMLDESKHYPLILLHVTLLPIRFPWSLHNVQELVPDTVRDRLQVLRGKVSETILQRGILIPHPREEYEVLEERLLEALELREERVTKCGHFRRESSGEESGAEDSDSGMGSSVEGLEPEVCDVCHHHFSTVKSAVDGKRKWTIKVYAANGLMRAPAWAAAWSEMERVDVEVLPFIGEELRKKLDARQELEDAEERARMEAEDERVKMLIDEQMRLDEERAKRNEEMDQRMRESKPIAYELRNAQRSPSFSEPTDRASSPAVTADLPQIYRPAEIPLAVLLRNYLFLLAQDRRNVVIFSLSLLVLLFGIRSTSSTANVGVGPVAPLEEACAAYHTDFVGHALGGNVTEASVQTVNATEAANGSSIVVVEVPKTEEEAIAKNQQQDDNVQDAPADASNIGLLDQIVGSEEFIEVDG